MSFKPISPTAHVAMDYLTFPMLIASPPIFGLRGAGRALCWLYGGFLSIVNALTDNRLGLKRIIPMRVHGQIEGALLPTLILIPWITGALKERRSRVFFLSFFAASLAAYTLTDYEGKQRHRTRRSRTRPAVQARRGQALSLPRGESPV